jgi:LysM repeat protein
VNLPANIPQARYPDANAALSATGASSSNSSNRTNTESASPQKPDAAPVGSVSSSVPSTAPAGADHENLIVTNNAMAAVGLTPQLPTTNSTTTASDTNPLEGLPPSASADRYGLGSTNTANAADRPLPQSAQPVEPSFAGAWPEIQSALDRGELSRAHQLLSKWYNDDSLTPAEAEKVETLLGQLAGTVVYSTEHQLEPAYTVRPGQNLESIAKDFNVPWQLLARINGVASVDAVQPGQKLKVVRGPFSAIVDVRRSQLTLLVDGRYAGKFPVTVPPGVNVTDGKWLVDQKLAAPAASFTQTANSPTSAVERTIVLRAEDGSTGKAVATGPTLTIASGSAPAGPATAAAIRISSQDAAELSDILSIGSRVTIQR